MRKAGKEERKKRRREGSGGARRPHAQREEELSDAFLLFLSHQLSHRVVDHVSMCWREVASSEEERREERKAEFALLLIRHVLHLVLEGLLGRLGQTLALGLNAAHEHTQKMAKQWS